MIMRKLEGPELLPLLLASALIESFVWPTRYSLSNFGAQGALLAGIIAFPLLWMLLTIYGKKAERTRPKWFTYLLIGTLLFSIAIELTEYQRFYTQVLGSHLPIFWFLALSLVVAAYGQAMSEGALGRTAQLVLVFLVISTGLLLISAVDQMEIESLECAPISECGFGTAFAMRMMLRPEFLLFPIIHAHPANNMGTRKKAFFLPACIFVVDSVLILSLELILGNGWQIQQQPVYMIARLGTFSVFRRMDALHLCVWMMLFFLRIALYFWAVAHLAQDASHHHSRTRVFCLSSFIALILFAVVLRLPWRVTSSMHQGLLWSILIIPFFWKGGKSH